MGQVYGVDEEAHEVRWDKGFEVSEAVLLRDCRGTKNVEKYRMHRIHRDVGLLENLSTPLHVQFDTLSLRTAMFDYLKSSGGFFLPVPCLIALIRR